MTTRSKAVILPTSTQKVQKLSIIHGPTSPPLLRLTFGMLLQQRAQHNAEDLALISQHQNEVLTYEDLHRRSNDLAAALMGLGVVKGDRVAVMLGNRSEYVDIFFACAKLGAFVTLINYAYTPAELVAALNATTPKILLTCVQSGRYDYRDVLSTISTTVFSLERAVLLPDASGTYLSLSSSPFFLRYDDFLRRGQRQHPDWQVLESQNSPTDILNLQFTSGSTGAPKAAALTHSGILNSAYYIGLQMAVAPTDKIVIPLPLFHAFGLIIGLCTAWVAGASLILPSEYFSPSCALDAVGKYSATGLYGVTTMMIDMLSHPRFSTTDRASLRFGVMAGSAMPEELLTRVMTKFPIRDLFTNWGMTELSSIATMTTATDPLEKKMRTAGRLLPNFIGKIVVLGTGTAVPWGEKGEIVVAGFGVMSGYFGDAERTEVTLRKHREDLMKGEAGLDKKGSLRTWMHTGDEGYLDQDGYFVITGRIKDLIIRGGENIAPLEIEERLFAHPAVKQAAVFGVRSERYGEEVACMLEVEEEWRERRPRDKEVRDWVGEKLARYKRPVRVWWLGLGGCPAEWMKTSNGKLRKRDIRAVAEGLMRREETVKEMATGRAKL